MRRRFSRLGLALGLPIVAFLPSCGSVTSSFDSDIRVVYNLPPKGCSELGFLAAPSLPFAASYAQKRGANVLYVERDSFSAPERDDSRERLVRVFSCEDPGALPHSYTYHFRRM